MQLFPSPRPMQHFLLMRRSHLPAALLNAGSQASVTCFFGEMAMELG